MAASDIDLGSGSFTITAKRFMSRADWNRDKETKSEYMAMFVQQTNKNADTGQVISVERYMINLTDAVINTCDGHNKFLNDLKALGNQCVTEFKASGSLLDPITGSVVSLDQG